MNGTQFTPLKNFADPDLRSEYVVGLSYTVRDYFDPVSKTVVKAQDCLLAKKLPSWLEAGLVRLGAPNPADTQALVSGGAASTSGVQGSGTVE